MMLAPSSLLSLEYSCSISDWVTTSSALVGSSATRKAIMNNNRHCDLDSQCLADAQLHRIFLLNLCRAPNAHAFEHLQNGPLSLIV